MIIQRKYNKGLTLIEALIWMLISASVLFLAFVTYSDFRENQRIDQASDELKYMYPKYKAIVNSTPSSDMSSLTPVVLKNLGVIPGTIKSVDATNAIGLFGNINLKYTAGTGNFSTFSVTYQNVPKGKYCFRLIKSQENVGWTRVNGISIKSGSALLQNTICGNTGSGTVNLIFWADNIYQPTDLNADD